MSEASGHRGLWVAAKYPGDDVRSQMLYRGGHGYPVELGDVRIQDYGSFLRVGSFLPGLCEGMYDGDTPKIVPEKHKHFRGDNQADLADTEFDKLIQDAYADGWQNYDPNQHGGLR